MTYLSDLDTITEETGRNEALARINGARRELRESDLEEEEKAEAEKKIRQAQRRAGVSIDADGRERTKANTDLGTFAAGFDGPPSEAAEAYRKLPDS